MRSYMCICRSSELGLLVTVLTLRAKLKLNMGQFQPGGALSGMAEINVLKCLGVHGEILLLFWTAGGWARQPWAWILSMVLLGVEFARCVGFMWISSKYYGLFCSQKKNKTGCSGGLETPDYLYQRIYHTQPFPGVSLHLMQCILGYTVCTGDLEQEKRGIEIGNGGEIKKEAAFRIRRGVELWAQPVSRLRVQDVMDRLICVRAPRSCVLISSIVLAYWENHIYITARLHTHTCTHTHTEREQMKFPLL